MDLQLENSYKLYRNCCNFLLLKLFNILANSVDPDQTLLYAASDLGIHYLPVAFLGTGEFEWNI